MYNKNMKGFATHVIKATPKTNLKTHIQSKHEDVCYSCEFCSYKATEYKNLRRNTRSKHNVFDTLAFTKARQKCSTVYGQIQYNTAFFQLQMSPNYLTLSVYNSQHVYSNGKRLTVPDSLLKLAPGNAFLSTQKNSTRKHVQERVQVSLVIRKY